MPPHDSAAELFSQGHERSLPGRVRGGIHVSDVTNEGSPLYKRMLKDFLSANTMLQPNQRICRCQECSLRTITSGAGKIKGRVVSSRTYGLHQKPRYAIIRQARFPRAINVVRQPRRRRSPRSKDCGHTLACCSGAQP